MPADEGRKKRNTIAEDSENLTSSAVAAPTSKKPKSRRKLKLFLLLILLIAGVITGMHESGFIDARPFIWNTAPKIPFIGDYLKYHLDIPDVYTLTVPERRKLELQQWQERLEEKERELRARSAQSEIMSIDIAQRQQKIDKYEAKLLEEDKDINTKVKGEVTPEEEALMKELTDTYREISPRRTAKIMAQLPDHLAIELLKKMPQDTRASILSKMDPKRAAKMSENFINPQ